MTRIPVDPATIRALAQVLTESGLTEIEICDKDTRVRLARTVSAAPVATVTSVAAAAPVAVAAPTPAAPQDLSAHPGAVTSPMVGVAYLAPEPGAAPYITIGQQVSAGQTLLLIEAMKTFNQIKAPKAGTVARTLASSGTPVEYGEVLIILE